MSSRRFAVALVAFSTFIDIVAYSIAVPVLPDLSRRLGASPTIIGFLFASFGLTVLIVSLPMGSISDRIGRKVPLIVGLAALAGASTLFALADRLSWLFAARLVQGGADAVTWVVGFALLADLYSPAERGRVMGLAMSSASFGFMVGPTIGGWLYELGGVALPFLFVAAGAAVAAAGFAVMRIDARHVISRAPSTRRVLRVPAVVACVIAVVALGATISMFEPVFALFLGSRIHLGPARIGLVFGSAALVNIAAHPFFGQLAGRIGARRLTNSGLVSIAATLPLLALTTSFRSAILFSIITNLAISATVTPSLALMGEAVSSSGTDSFGLAYGLYNFAWAIGLFAGPAIGGFMFERLGLLLLTLIWAPCVIATTAVVVRISPGVRREIVEPRSVLDGR